MDSEYGSLASVPNIPIFPFQHDSLSGTKTSPEPELLFGLFFSRVRVRQQKIFTTSSMTNMETQTRVRPPHLQPIWTEPRRSGGGGYPPSPYTARDAAYSPGTRSPNMPSLLYPRSPGYDHSMRRHERAMVDRLDQRNWPAPLESPTSRGLPRGLSPITELRSNGNLRPYQPQPHSHSYNRSPRSPDRPLPAEYDYPRRPTLADESRSILLSRAPEPRPAAQATSSLAERRRSLPPSFPAARRAARQRRQELHAWGHVYLGNGSEADCFVSPVGLRRLSDASSGEENAAADREREREREYRRQSRLTIRARVRPRALERKPFILQRTFDMDELRATVPEAEPTSPSSRRQSADFPNRNSQPYDPARPDREIDKAPARSIKTVPIRKLHAPFCDIFVRRC